MLCLSSFMLQLRRFPFEVLLNPFEPAQKRLAQRDPDLSSRASSGKADSDYSSSDHVPLSQVSVTLASSEHTVLLIVSYEIVHYLGYVQERVLRTNSDKRSEVSNLNDLSLYNFVQLWKEC